MKNTLLNQLDALDKYVSRPSFLRELCAKSWQARSCTHGLSLLILVAVSEDGNLVRRCIIEVAIVGTLTPSYADVVRSTDGSVASQ